jgi:hypothetical protein
MRRNHFVLLLVLVAVCGQVASAGGNKKKSDQSAPPEITKVSTLFPTLAPLEGTEMSQKKGGLRVSLTLAPYELKKAYVKMVQPVNPSFKESIFAPPNARFVARTCRPVLGVEPNRLKFGVTISNDMSRVFRGSGVYVRFNVAGKETSVDKEAWAALADAIIAPRGDMTVDIYGPKVNTLPQQGGTISLFFDDVVTGVDNAGNVTERQNFEWHFQFRTELKEAEMEVPPPIRGWVPPGGQVPDCPPPPE